VGNIVAFGTLTFTDPVVLSVTGELESSVAVFEKPSGFPSIQLLGDKPEEIRVALRYTSTSDLAPQLNTIREAIQARRQLNIGSYNFGNFILKKVSYQLNDIDSRGFILSFDCQLDFLESAL
jgi:hypothetical protein